MKKISWTKLLEKAILLFVGSFIFAVMFFSWFYPEHLK